jgi:hypothetical protein
MTRNLYNRNRPTLDDNGPAQRGWTASRAQRDCILRNSGDSHQWRPQWNSSGHRIWQLERLGEAQLCKSEHLDFFTLCATTPVLPAKAGARGCGYTSPWWWETNYHAGLWVYPSWFTDSPHWYACKENQNCWCHPCTKVFKNFKSYKS